MAHFVAQKSVRSRLVYRYHYIYYIYTLRYIPQLALLNLWFRERFVGLSASVSRLQLREICWSSIGLRVNCSLILCCRTDPGVRASDVAYTFHILRTQPLDAASLSTHLCPAHATLLLSQPSLTKENRSGHL